VLIAETTHVPTYVAEDPLSCVALGTGKALEQRRGITEDLLSN